MITIVDYNPCWPDEFRALAQPLQVALGALAVRIDHIGSTSVPGLAAKDIIDIQITVCALAPDLEPALAALGYVRDVAITTDHRPPQASGPTSDWAKWYFRPPPTLRRMHLHVRVAGRPNQRYPLVFRDYLRAHPLARDAYGLIKRQLARYHSDDVEAYYDIKDPVCDIIWSAAEAWAQASTWQPTLD